MPSAKFLLVRHAFIYIHFPVLCEPPTISREKKSGETAAINFIPNRFSSRFSTSRTNGPRLLSLPKAGTHSPFREKSHTRAHTPKQGCFGWGWYHYPRTVLRGSETLRGQGVERQTLPLLGLGRGCSQRTQKAFGTAMRSCASLFRGVAAPLGCVIFLLSSKFRFVLPAIRAFRVCETWGYHYPRRALRVVETPGVRLSKRLMSKTPIFS